MSNMGSTPPEQYYRLKPFLDFFQEGTPILMYHKIGLRPRKVRLKGLYVRPDAFERQVEEFAREGFQTVSPAEARTPAARACRRVALTFDDGFKNVFDNALEPLARHKMRAMQFLVVNSIGKLNEWDLRDGEAPEPLMDEAQVRDWLAAGHWIGSHSLTHARLTRLTARDAREEIVASKKRLEDMFGLAVEDFCYPYGDFSPAVRDLVMEAGYRTACTTEYGLNGSETPALELRRITVRHPTRTLKTLTAALSEAAAEFGA
ncbi:MAG TPA: polysaccharide deacetylase family protein [Verrucomicrobiae bacterium]|jgi:peptidoglycan/xylan/chitin deacetylase (PgdA/CDA1 family)|nr:polysaccharide deacetylase family protein [Verrucomicrobiae bacterium]